MKVKFAMLGAIATLALGAVPAQASFNAPAATPIASFATLPTLAGGLEWANSGPGNAGTGGSIYTTVSPGFVGFSPITVNFSFLPGSGITGQVSNIPAQFQLQATAPSGNPAVPFPISQILQMNISHGFYSFTSLQSRTLNGFLYPVGTPLLYGKFDRARIRGSNGGTNMNFYDSTGQSGGTLSMVSYVTTFSGPYAFSIKKFGMTTPLSALPGKALKSFDPDFSGTFSTGAVPEPASWAMMIMGFGMVGTVSRRRHAERAARSRHSLAYTAS